MGTKYPFGRLVNRVTTDGNHPLESGNIYNAIISVLSQSIDGQALRFTPSSTAYATIEGQSLEASSTKWI